MMNHPITEGIQNKLSYKVFSNRVNMGAHAGKKAEEKIVSLLKVKDEIRIIFAAAPSQNEMLQYLTKSKEIDWSRVNGLHMDEYIGLSKTSDQWFKNFLQKHLIDHVNMKSFHFLDGGSENLETEVDYYASLLSEDSIDLVCLGIGENGHLAFNDPPVADFNDPQLVKIVELDITCRKQQVNDGCFSLIEDVPTHAITLTIPALMSATSLICTVSGETKATATKKTLLEDISTECPSTIMRTHRDAILFLDKDSFGQMNYERN